MGIVESFEEFFYKYTQTECYQNSYIFRNKKLTFSPEERNFLTDRYFDRDFFSRNVSQITNFRVGDFLTDGRIKSRENFNNDNNIIISPMTYGQLTGIIRTAKTKHKEYGIVVDDSFEDFFKFKKGSRKFRKILTLKINQGVPHNLLKFSDNTDTIINSTICQTLNGYWCNAKLSGEFATFLFKFFNNRLGYNYTLSKFIHGISENCTLCEIARHEENNRETPLHLFWDCEKTYTIIEEFFNWLLIATGENSPTRQEFFVLFERNNNNFNNVMNLISKLLIFCIWQNKQRKTLPDITSTKRFIFSELQILTSLDNEFKNTVKNSGIRRLQHLGINILSQELDGGAERG